jgi:cephalosporin hydroxylase
MIRKILDALRSRPPEPRTSYSAAGAANLEIDKWAASDAVLWLQRIVGKHPYPLDELMLMTAAFGSLRPDVVVEIGTHVGKSARIWWELSRLFGCQTAIHTIDLHDPSHAEYPGASLGKMIKGLPIVQHVGDGFDVADQLLLDFQGRRCLLFLDGDHAFDSVSKELALAVRHPCVAAVLLHDTFFQPESGYNHGPYEAVQQFLASHTVRQVVHAHLGLPGMTYLRMEGVRPHGVG